MIELIHKYICKKRNVPPDKIMERHPVTGRLRQNREYVICRQLIAYYAMANGFGEREVGNYFNGQDHATMNHAKKTIRGLCDIYRDFALDIARYDRVLIGLRGLSDRELMDRLEYDDIKMRTEYIIHAVQESKDTIEQLEKRLNSLKILANEIQI